MQGAQAVPQMLAALSDLDADQNISIVVLARGGGSVEDLLPFSDETLCRAVAAAGTPIVSAIGHEPDTPLLDHVADLRCSTPTDAGKRVVPDVAEEASRVSQLRDRARRALHGWVDTQARLLEQLRNRPVLADPLGPVERRAEEVATARERARREILAGITREETALVASRARLNALGPAATLGRGYAVVQYADDNGEQWVLRSVTEVAEGTPLRIRVGDGAVHAVATGASEQPATTADQQATAFGE